MKDETNLDTLSVCSDLQRLTGSAWEFKHDNLRHQLDAFVGTLPTQESAKVFQHKLVDNKIHFSRYPAAGFGHPSLTFGLRPEEAVRYIASQTPSVVVEPSRAAPIVPDADKNLTR